MKVTTRQSAAAEAPQRWDEQYANFPDIDGTKATIARELKKLGKSPDPDAIDRIIGNDSWTHLTCNECGDSVDAVVQVGQEPDYESATAELCIKCVKAAVELLESELAKAQSDVGSDT